MYLIEILLPIYNNTGEKFPKEAFAQVRAELTSRFGGVTAFLRSPALGLWRDETGTVRRDDIATFEVMCDEVDHAWWQNYRQQLEERFQQEEVVIRATASERL